MCSVTGGLDRRRGHHAPGMGGARRPEFLEEAEAQRAEAERVAAEKARQAQLHRDEAARSLHQSRQQVDQLFEEARSERAEAERIAVKIVDEARGQANEIAEEDRVDRREAARILQQSREQANQLFVKARAEHAEAKRAATEMRQQAQVDRDEASRSLGRAREQVGRLIEEAESRRAEQARTTAELGVAAQAAADQMAEEAQLDLEDVARRLGEARRQAGRVVEEADVERAPLVHVTTEGVDAAQILEAKVTKQAPATADTTSHPSVLSPQVGESRRSPVTVRLRAALAVGPRAPRSTVALDERFSSVRSVGLRRLLGKVQAEAHQALRHQRQRRRNSSYQSHLPQ